MHEVDKISKNKKADKLGVVILPIILGHGKPKQGMNDWEFEAVWVMEGAPVTEEQYWAGNRLSGGACTKLGLIPSVAPMVSALGR